MKGAGGITTVAYGDVTQILADSNHVIAYGAIIDNTAKDSDAKCLAGTPLFGDLTKRGGGADAFVEETTTTGVSNANCVLLHEIEFSGANDANGVVVVHGVIQLARLASAVKSMYTAAVIKSLAANGIYVI